MKKFNIVILLVIICVFVVSGIFVFFKYGNSLRETNIEPNKVVNIVFTSDAKYREYLKVTLKSAIMNKKADSVYKINILCVDLPQQDMDAYEKMSEKNVSIKSIPMKVESIKDVGDFPVSNNVSRADLFKFFMPSIFPKNDKILYIDSDTIILGDLLDLYNTDISKYSLGAVYKYTPIYNWKKVFFAFYIREVFYEYNCGVMLMNLKKMRRDNITQKLIESKNNDEERNLMTQSAFNDILPSSKIKKLSPVYNFISRWKPIYFKTYDFKITYAPYLDNINSFDELQKKAVIVHFAGKSKPWYNPDVNFGDKWWYYAKMVNANWKIENAPEQYYTNVVIW